MSGWKTAYYALLERYPLRWAETLDWAEEKRERWLLELADLNRLPVTGFELWSGSRIIIENNHI